MVLKLSRKTSFGGAEVVPWLDRWLYLARVGSIWSTYCSIWSTYCVIVQRVLSVIVWLEMRCLYIRRHGDMMVSKQVDCKVERGVEERTEGAWEPEFMQRDVNFSDL